MLALVAVIAAGCTTTRNGPARQGVVRGAVERPLRDLNVVRESPEQVLQRAAEQPYRGGDLSCSAIAEEIAALDAALGPDVDVPQPPQGRAGEVEDLASSSLEGAIGLPFRGVIRHVSGAESAERATKAAIIAGVARRAYLKGLSAGRRCKANDEAAAQARPRVAKPD